MKQTLAKNVHDLSWTRTYPSNHLSLLLRFLEESISAENVQWEYTIENRKLHFNYYLSFSLSLFQKTNSTHLDANIIIRNEILRIFRDSSSNYATDVGPQSLERYARVHTFLLPPRISTSINQTLTTRILVYNTLQVSN